MMVIGTPSLTHEKPQNKPPSTSRKYSFNKVFFSTDAFPNAALSAALANSAGLSKDEHQVNVLFDKLQVLFWQNQQPVQIFTVLNLTPSLDGTACSCPL